MVLAVPAIRLATCADACPRPKFGARIRFTAPGVKITGPGTSVHFKTQLKDP